MPNTPAAIGRGITAITGNAHATEAIWTLAEELLSAVGEVVRLEGEHQMDAVTAVSGSGPAYVFHLIETLAAAGVAEGLPQELAMQLAGRRSPGRASWRCGGEDPAQLRVNVTSPGGTTAAALGVLMDAETGFPPLLRRAVQAAARARSGAGQVMISFDDFLKVDIRVGASSAPNPSPRRASPRSSSGSISAPRSARRKARPRSPVHYTPEALIGRQVMAVVNFPPRQIGPFMSEVLVLGVPDEEGAVVLLGPDLDVPLGGRMH